MGGEASVESPESQAFFQDISNPENTMNSEQIMATCNQILLKRSYRQYFKITQISSMIEGNPQNFMTLLNSLLDFFKSIPQVHYLSKGQLSFFSLLFSSSLGYFLRSQKEFPGIDKNEVLKIANEYLAQLANLLFYEPLTIEKGKTFWYDENPSLQEIRADVMIAILLIHPIKINNFPTIKFLKSILAQIEFLHSNPTEKQQKFVCAMISILCVLPFYDSSVSDSIQTFSADELFEPFKNNYEILKFSTISTEALTFFYVCCVFNPGFVSKIADFHPRILYERLLFLLQSSLETSGVNFIHSIIISVLLIISMNQKAVLDLNNVFNISTSFSYVLHRGNFCDVLIELTSNLISSSPLQKPIVSIWHAITPYTADFTMISANKIFLLFQKMISKPKEERSEKDEFVIKCILEIFATAIQSPQHYSLKMIAIRYASVIKHLPDDYKETRDIIMRFMKIFKAMAKKYMEKTGKSDLNVDNAIYLLEKLGKETIFKKLTIFQPHPHVISPEMKKTWDIWVYSIASHCQQ